MCSELPTQHTFSGSPLTAKQPTAQILRKSRATITSHLRCSMRKTRVALKGAFLRLLVPCQQAHHILPNESPLPASILETSRIWLAMLREKDLNQRDSFLIRASIVSTFFSSSFNNSFVIECPWKAIFHLFTFSTDTNFIYL